MAARGKPVCTMNRAEIHVAIADHFGVAAAQVTRAFSSSQTEHLRSLLNAGIKGRSVEKQTLLTGAGLTMLAGAMLEPGLCCAAFGAAATLGLYGVQRIQPLAHGPVFSSMSEGSRAWINPVSGCQKGEVIAKEIVPTSVRHVEFLNVIPGDFRRTLRFEDDLRNGEATAVKHRFAHRQVINPHAAETFVVFRRIKAVHVAGEIAAPVAQGFGVIMRRLDIRLDGGSKTFGSRGIEHSL